MPSASLEVRTTGRGLYDVTGEIQRLVRDSGVKEGLVLVFVGHTSASLVVQENADPSVQRDLLEFFERLVPESRSYEHGYEGADDMPAHIRTALTHTSEIIPLTRGRLQLGTWQAVYLFEHRRAGHRRHIAVRILEDS